MRFKIDIKQVFTKDYWNLKNFEASPRKKFFVKQIRIFSLAMKGFTEDKVQVRASALTYYTMLSIVPIAAMVFAIAKGFGFDENMEKIIRESFARQQNTEVVESSNIQQNPTGLETSNDEGEGDVIADWIIEVSQDYLENANGGVIAGIGILVLLWSVMRLLGNIESAFNDIWQIKKSRGMSRKMSDYISLVVIAPILMLVSVSINVFLEEQEGFLGGIPLIEYIGPILGLLLKLAPFVFIWLVFMLVYIIMPNTKVKIGSALIGGVIAGTLFQLLNSLYINFQSELTSSNAAYGSLAALPMFMIWLQLSWLIVLLGAEVAFANQNVGHYESESESLNISSHMKRVVSLVVVKQIALNFKNNVMPMTAEELADKMDLPVRLVRDILYELQEVGVVSETVTDNVKENAYQPACNTDLLSVNYVIGTLDKRGHDALETDNQKELEAMTAIVDKYGEVFENTADNKLLVEI